MRARFNHFLAPYLGSNKFSLTCERAGKATGALRSLMYEIVPLTTVSGAVYSAGSCLTADARGSHDWVSNAVGGATAGAVIAGVKKQSLQGAFVGALAFGTAAAAVQWWSAMSPSVSEVEKRAPSPAALVHAPTPAALATSSRSSASLVSRLQ